MNQEPKQPKPSRYTKTQKVIAGLTLAAGLSGGIVAAEQGLNSNSRPTPSLSDQLKHPLSPLYTQASPNGYEVAPGQQPPVAETVSEVPGHKDEVEVQFGAESNGVIPPGEIVKGTIPNIKPGEDSPLFNVGISPADIRPTPGAPKKAPPKIPTWDLKDELANPLGGPKPGEESVTPSGQQVPGGETIEQVPGHPNEAKVIFGQEDNGQTPPSETVTFSPSDSPFKAQNNSIHLPPRPATS